MILISCPIHEVFIKTLEQQGLTCIHAPSITYDELLPKMPELTALVISTSIRVDKKLLDAGKNLQWIARVGSGMEQVDVAYAVEKNIRCISSPEGNRDAVADHCIGLLLALTRNICKSHAEVKTYAWLRKENTGSELAGKKIGIIGYGNTGTVFVKRLSGFDVDILVHDKYKKGFSKEGLMETSVDHIAEAADIISFHLPLTPETHHYATGSFFNKLQRKPIILNTSRGAIVNTNALYDALENGLISGAGLDVLENENAETFQSPENELIRKLIQHPSVLITPHIAGYTQEANYKMAMVLLQKLGMA